MFFLDIETLDTEQTSVVLSIGIIHMPSPEPMSFEDILSRGLFVKLDSRSQISAGRTTSKDTMDWWSKQPKEIQQKNLIPSKDDLHAAEAISKIKEYIKDRDSSKRLTCFTRGSFDSVILDHLCKKTLGVEPLFKFWEYRDVRTAIDIIYAETSNRSYVKIDESRCPGANKWMNEKHSPDVDAALDAAMILFGV